MRTDDAHAAPTPPHVLDARWRQAPPPPPSPERTPAPAKATRRLSSEHAQTIRRSRALTALVEASGGRSRALALLFHAQDLVAQRNEHGSPDAVLTEALRLAHTVTAAGQPPTLTTRLTIARAA